MKETRRGGIQTIQQIIRRLSEENQERRNPNNSTSHQKTLRAKPGEEISRQFNKSSEDSQSKTRRGGIQTIQQVIRRLSEENQERGYPDNPTSHQKTVRGKPGEEGSKQFNKSSEDCQRKTSLSKHLIIGARNNDLDKKKMTHLLHSISRRSENCSIHVLPAFERVNQRTFNNKVYHFNTEAEKVWANYSNCKFIKNPLISSSDKTLFPDGVHFSTSGMTRFVRIIKPILTQS